MIQIQITDTFLMQQNIQLENKWTRNISPICLTFLLWEKRSFVGFVAGRVGDICQ